MPLDVPSLVRNRKAILAKARLQREAENGAVISGNEDVILALVERALETAIPLALYLGVKQVLFVGHSMHVMNREILIPGASREAIKTALKSIPGITVGEDWVYVIANFETE